MNLINWRLVIAAIFLSILSCKKKKSEIGLSLQDNQFQTQVDDSTLIEAKSFKLDTIRTDNKTSWLLGNCTDPLIGISRAGIYSQITLSGIGSPGQSLFENAEIDSTVMFLRYDNAKYGTGSQITYDIFEVTEDFPSSAIYSDQTLALGQSLIEAGAAVHIVDTIISQDILKIRMNSIFGEKMQNAEAITLESAESFQEYFKGVYVKSTNDDGSVMSYNLTDSKISMYYHTLTEDSLVYDFPLGGVTKKFTHIDHEYALNFDGDTLVSGEFLFVQGGGSMGAKISFVDLKERHHAGEIYNKVELILPYDSLDVSQYSLPQTIRAFVKNEDGEYELIGKKETYKDNSVRLDLTAYIQGVIDEDKENSPIFLLPDTENSDGKSQGISIGRVPILREQIKLNIVHTE